MFHPHFKLIKEAVYAAQYYDEAQLTVCIINGSRLLSFLPGMLIPHYNRRVPEITMPYSIIKQSICKYTHGRY